MFDTATTTTATTAIDVPRGKIVSRDDYGALFNSAISPAAHALMSSVEQSAGWKFGIANTNRRGGFVAHNFDIYGFDDAKNLAVVQLRRTSRRNSTRYTVVEKIYALIGEDDGQIFSHVLENSPRRLRDIHDRSPESVVAWAEQMIFGLKSEADIANIKRQGDVALVPVKKLPKNAVAVEAGEVVFRDSHRLIGNIFKSGDDYFCVGGRETRLLHTKREHGAVYTRKGEIFRVVVGRRGNEPWWTTATIGD